MQNEKGEIVDLYIPRRCYATNKLLDARDHSSVQISISNSGLDPSITKSDMTLVLSGFVRSKGMADAAVNRFLKSKGLLSFE